MDYAKRTEIMQECCERTAKLLNDSLGTWPIGASVHLEETHNWLISFAVSAREDLFTVEEAMEKFYLPAVDKLTFIVNEESHGKKFTMFPMLRMPHMESVIASAGNTHVRAYRSYDMETHQTIMNVDIHVVSIG